MSWLLYTAHLLVLPWLLVGLIRTGKARLANRRGPSWLQPLRDAAKLLRKTETVSQTTTWVFRAAPVLTLSSVALVALMIPWLGIAAPLSGDLVLVVYVLAVGRFATMLAALDSGSAFGALGASREAALSVQTEPALVLALAALAVSSHSADLGDVLRHGGGAHHLMLLVPLLVGSLWLVAMGELGRMPVDDPTTHLELTMIHEAMVLENSGPGLALVEYTSALKLTLLLGLVAQVILRLVPAPSGLLAYGLSVALLLVGAAVIVVGESTLVRLHWRRLPNLLSFGLLASALACLLTAMWG